MRPLCSGHHHTRQKEKQKEKKRNEMILNNPPRDIYKPSPNPLRRKVFSPSTPAFPGEVFLRRLIVSDSEKEKARFVVYIIYHGSRSLTYRLPKLGDWYNDLFEIMVRLGKEKEKREKEKRKGAGMGKGGQAVKVQDNRKNEKEKTQRNHLQQSCSPNPQTAPYPFPKNFFTLSTPAFPF